MAVADPQPDERAALIGRILDSRGFRKSARLRDFLRYVAGRALEQPGVQIREQEIASRVFERDSSVDCREDTLVRVQASQLRKRLEQYFREEGAGEAWGVEIPKGNYAPVFVRREAGKRSHRRFQWWAIAAALLAALGVSAVVLAGRGRPARPHTGRYVRLFWEQLFRPGQATQVVLADASLSMFQLMAGRTVGVTEYASRSWRATAARIPDPTLRQHADLLAGRQFTSFADAVLAHRFLGLDTVSSGRLVFTRDFLPRSLQTDNVIFIGSRRSNPWMELLEPSLDFRYRYDQGAITVQNLAPGPGEQPEYQVRETGTGIQEGYCIVTFAPNSARTGVVLNLAGSEMEATEAGGEFITSDGLLARLHGQLRLPAGARFPYFQALLKTTKVGGTSPNFEIAAVHLLKF